MCCLFSELLCLCACLPPLFSFFFFSKVICANFLSMRRKLEAVCVTSVVVGPLETKVAFREMNVAQEAPPDYCPRVFTSNRFMATAVIRSAFECLLMTDERILKRCVFLTANCTHKVRNSQAQSYFL